MFFSVNSGIQKVKIWALPVDLTKHVHVCTHTSIFTHINTPGGPVVKNQPAVQEMRVPSLSQEDPLEEGMTTHPSIFAGKILWPEELGRLWSMESQRVGHD